MESPGIMPLIALAGGWTLLVAYDVLGTQFPPLYRQHARTNTHTYTRTHTYTKYDQVLQNVPETIRALSAVQPINPANEAVVLAMVLGSRTVEMSATQSLTTHGLRASRLVKVCHAKRIPCMTCSGAPCLIERLDAITYDQMKSCSTSIAVRQ